MISVIIPCYNAEPFLAEALESVLKQTRPVGEILVVDDCSTDRSGEIARSYGARVISMDRNRGHAAARNAGVDAARGNLIAWLDADDYWNPNHCEVVCGLLERHPDAAVAYSAVRYFGGLVGVEHYSPRDYEPFDAFWDCFRWTIVPAMSAVTRRSALLEVGSFNPQVRIAPDFDIWLRMAQRFRFVSTPEVTANYRMHPVQISSNPDRQLRSMYQTRDRFLRTTRRQGDGPLAQLLEKELLAIWDEDLLGAWREGRVGRLRMLLGLPGLGMIPRETSVSARLRWRSRLPAWVWRQWRRVCMLLARVRTLLGRLARPPGSAPGACGVAGVAAAADCPSPRPQAGGQEPPGVRNP